MKHLLLLLSLFLSNILSAQTGTQSNLTLEHNGINREYILYVPQAYDGQTEYPLLLNLHGYGSSMLEQIFYGEFRDIADTANFIMAVPNGTLDPTGERYWNFFVPAGADDLGFLSDLIDEISTNYEINTNRVYSTGMSNGGFMSYYLACNLSDKITAIASVTGTMDASQLAGCTPTKPVPTMSIHGTDDAVVPYNGNITFASVPNVVDHWVAQTNTNTSPVVTQLPDIDPTDNCTAEHYLYENGTNGATVEHYKIVDGGHTWPGAIFDIGVTNHDFDASTVIWRFFSQFNSAELLSAKEENQLDKIVNIYPNPSNGTINIDINQSIDQLEIISAQGQILRSLNNVDKSLTFTSVKPGIYFVKIHSKGKVTTQKAIVR
ncbi:T9SS type A sorting domain-containing protein [Brumimicrobium oceani]|uniref:Uncharacterized protein n=1 Tax=Brumimicrobium oceani TaxID=2100725 RepID=A0A2U2XB06_9FLAO|nr:T9SS type A sorting domain-containing protein [Brumimicrobium oceani]PWH84972.1 hypothetical protein DIT68_11400 [Brumimicrobium oceani]